MNQAEIIKQTQRAVDIVKNTKHQGELKNPDSRAEVGGMCGDRIEFQIKVENDIITDVKYNTLGCVAAIASSEVLAERVKGKKLSEIREITTSQLVKELGLPNVKHHCAAMAVDSLKQAIKNYKN
jgi:nitrogen fixation NifU-like protein